MSRSLELLSYWLPVFLWLGVILFASTGRFAVANTAGRWVSLLSRIFPEASSHRLLRGYLLIRKLSHWTGYFVLGLLLARAVSFEFPDTSEFTQFGWTLGLVVFCAVADEYHQTRVPDRQGSWSDVLIDSAGGFTALCIWYA